MAACTELYIDTLGGLDLDGSTDKNLPYFVVENLATLCPMALVARTECNDGFSWRCRQCNTHCSVRTGSFFANCDLTTEKIVMVMY